MYFYSGLMSWCSGLDTIFRMKRIVAGWLCGLFVMPMVVYTIHFAIVFHQQHGSSCEGVSVSQDEVVCAICNFHFCLFCEKPVASDGRFIANGFKTFVFHELPVLYTTFWYCFNRRGPPC